IAAHMTATTLYPRFVAENANDEEDRDAGQVMTDISEWIIENSDYKRKFLQAVISALVAPATIVEFGFAEVMRKIKEIQDDGSWTEKEILDEIMSGFQTHLVPVGELLIANFYEPDIQKQRFLIRRKYIDYKEAKAIYGGKENWKYVNPGVFAVFNHEDNSFYDVQDDEEKDNQVLEVRYYSRMLDLELVFINGIIMCDPTQPIKRKDKRYRFAKTIFEPLNDGQCFYGKSAASKLGSDQEVIDTLYNMVLDGSYLQLMPPMALYGSEEVDSSVIVPGMITSFNDPNTKLDSIAPRTDTRGGLEAISMVERSMSESSQDNFRSGIGDTGGETARAVLLKDKNAEIAMGLFKHMIGFLVEDIGVLM
ncbi:MAG: hypothetical protein JSW01_02920, partial [Candidatus Bathyarchaeota archaeon]